jgi:hypothetical protein
MKIVKSIFKSSCKLNEKKVSMKCAAGVPQAVGSS